MPRVVADLVNERFGKLLVLEPFVVKGVGRSWVCLCDCGNKTKASTGNLLAGQKKSCGCGRQKKLARRNTEYERMRARKGDTKISWELMQDRCLNVKSIKYKDYGGRGITFSTDWLSYDKFLADMGERPFGTTLDRIDNNGNYCKENCKWSTPSQQANNRRNNRRVEGFGKTQTVAEWAAELKMPVSTLTGRLDKGMSIEEAFKLPKYENLKGADFYRKRKSSRFITAFGQTKTLIEWSEEYKISAAVLGARISKRGMTPEQAMTAPIVPRNARRSGMKSVLT
jgi:hypothetical protein